MKVPVTISIDEEQLKVIRRFCEVSGYPMSRLFNEHVSAIYKTILAAGLDKKAKYSKLDLLKMFTKGASMPV